MTEARTDTDACELVFGKVDGARTTYEFARGSSRFFVRSQFQVALDSPEATGSRLSAFDAFQVFGWEQLADVSARGASPLAADLKQTHRDIYAQLEAAGVGFDDIASRAEWSDEEKSRFIATGRASIHSIQKLAPFAGFDERSIGFRKAQKPDANVAYRMRTFGRDNAVKFSTNLKISLIEASWIIERQYQLAGALQDNGIIQPPQEQLQVQHDEDYGNRIVKPWQRGFHLAHSLRERLGVSQTVPISSMRNLIEDQFRIPVILISYPGTFAGATIETNGCRGIVVNISGIKGGALTRRTTLAHELCHIMFDAQAHLKSLHIDFEDDIKNYEAATNDKVERRANAFAVEFLVPRSEAADTYARSSTKAETINALMQTYGISASALRQHIANAMRVDISAIEQPPSEENFDEWKSAENSLTDYFPAAGSVPSQRLGYFSYYIALSLKHRLISADTACVLLSCQAHDLDRIISYIFELHPGVR